MQKNLAQNYEKYTISYNLFNNQLEMAKITLQTNPLCPQSLQGFYESSVGLIDVCKEFGDFESALSIAYWCIHQIMGCKCLDNSLSSKFSRLRDHIEAKLSEKAKHIYQSIPDTDKPMFQA